MRKSIVTASNVEVVSHYFFADVWLNTSSRQQSLNAAIAFKPGQVITKFQAGITQSFPTRLTLQIGLDKHIRLQPDCLQYTNHSCNPNTFFDTASMELVCIKPIETGDELSFFYPGTEWEMSQPFVCNCKSKTCLQLITGAAHLEKSTLEKYRLTDFINQQLKSRTVE